MQNKSKLYLNIFYFIIFITISISIYFTFYKKENTKKEISTYKNILIKIDNRDYTILQKDIRDTDKGRRDGLSSTSIDYLCDRCAMLFSWSEEGKMDSMKDRLIWMKDMNYNIDIYWLDEYMNVIHREGDVATSSYNSTHPELSIIYGRGYKAVYVLETKVHK